MYCKYCGNPTENDRPVCRSCARKRSQKKPKGFLGTLKSYMHMIVLLATVLTLIFGLLTAFSAFNVPCTMVREDSTVEEGTQKLRESGRPFEADDLLKTMDKSFMPGYIGNVLAGLFMLAACAVGALYSSRQLLGLPFYNQLIGRYIGGIAGPTMLMGLLGLMGNLLQRLMYLFCRASVSIPGYSVSVKTGVHWTAWVLPVLFIALIVLDIIVPKKRVRR